jgi:hypothetical protein
MRKLSIVVLVVSTSCLGQSAVAQQIVPHPPSNVRRVPQRVMVPYIWATPMGQRGQQPGARTVRWASAPPAANKKQATNKPPAVLQYPRFNAPLYPSPVQNVPVQVGGTIIQHPAFMPHEMMYAHEYKALYPPFYYKVRGRWWWTPFGIESHDDWELQGTEVSVKYRTKYNWRAPFFPPFRGRLFGGL